MEMAIEKRRTVSLSDEMIEKLLEAFKKSTGVKPTNKYAIEAAMMDKIEWLEKRSLVAKNR
ncbi:MULTISPECIES: hypothetical protein [Leptospira]|uniref:Uncharacterized protein n=1 Tax=Leptospira kirschneri str. H1 TaxID=1049966 RepID=A0A0E2B529_9LEPT|nr:MULTISPECIES: hypothetical protein [Leptospira]EKO16407.1 hypothetical protein LEP1GSC081_1356 [Leptospira kirschneri str. H1]